MKNIYEVSNKHSGGREFTGNANLGFPKILQFWDISNEIYLILGEVYVSLITLVETMSLRISNLALGELCRLL